MKNLIGVVLVALLSALSGPALAQQVSLGLKGGLNSSTVDVKEDPGFDINRRTSYHVGGILALDVIEAFGFQVEALYSRKGYEISGVGAEGALDAAYLAIPLLAKVRIPTKTRRVMPHFVAGPALGYELSCSGSGTVEGIVAVDEPCDDLELERKKFDVGLFFGGGFEFDFGRGIVMLDAAYDYGLRNLDDEPFSSDVVKSRTLCFSLGFLVPIGGERY